MGEEFRGWGAYGTVGTQFALLHRVAREILRQGISPTEQVPYLLSTSCLGRASGRAGRGGRGQGRWARERRCILARWVQERRRGQKRWLRERRRQPTP